MNTIRVSSPPFILLLVLLCLLAMFAASFQSLVFKPAGEHDAHKKTGANTAAVSTTPEGIGTLPEGGSSLDLTEKQADELTVLMKKLQSNPNDADALMEIGDTFLVAGDWQRADVFLTRAVLSRPGDIRPRYMLGISQYQQGKMQDAANTFEELLSMQEDPPTLYNLAVIYKYHLNNVPRAAELLQKAVDSSKADVDTVEKAKKEMQGM